ncbi:hypothetical protein GCM10023094_00920 [Rhodococcus olei]|uniref:Uncharacterized protein n=1 Tax=Rhodococcus olei TaxID=2161675 RepID=A0ABP8NTY2_9NOCA
MNLVDLINAMATGSTSLGTDSHVDLVSSLFAGSSALGGQLSA